MAHTQETTARQDYQYQQLDKDESPPTQESISLRIIQPVSEASENMSEVSRWGQSPLVILALTVPYLLGVAVAIGHYYLFHQLHQKRIEIDTSFPQSWVSSVSLVLVFIFRICVCFSLSVAFTQRLWRIVRLAPVRVSDLDRYHSIRTDIWALLHPRTIAGAPVLFVMASIGLLVGVAMIFPPGALTVENRGFDQFLNQTVRTYNGSYMGDGSIEDALDQSLCQTFPLTMQYIQPKPIAVATAKAALITGSMPVMTSPCGPNCTYTTVFEGLHVKCKSSTYNESAIIAPGALPAWYSDWTKPMDRSPSLKGRDYIDCPPALLGANYSIDTFPQGFFFDTYSNMIETIHSNNSHVMYQRTTTRLLCTPGVGLYTVKITFDNGIQNIDISSEYNGSFADLWANSGRWYSKSRQGGPIDGQLFVSAMNLMAIVDSLVELLSGILLSTISAVVDDKISLFFNPVDYSADALLPNVNQTIIRDTIFNKARFDWGRRDYFGLSDVIITESGINQALQNITIAMMQINPSWNTTTNVKQTNYDNYFSFSSKSRLIIPYACSVVAILPFLFLGYISMHLNGVPAITGGFVQTLMTTTGSNALRDAAAAGCLGGDQNIPKKLKDMEVIYGELIEDRKEGRLRRATFGLKDEIVALRKGGLYGK